MLFKAKVTPERKGDMVGTFLPGLAALAARELANQVPRIQAGHYAEGELDLLLELIAFYMHLANRVAFRELGAEQCSLFSHRLMVAVGNNVSTSLNKRLSSVQVVAELRDKYNEREVYYSQYRKFVADPGDSPKNTLFWEFTKVIFHGCVNTDNTLDLVLLQEILSPEIALFLKKTNEALKS
ncbi:MAG: hypothetical protein NTY38_13380 [Acidobacteria bacterium]|nr:hypothetical protein [Acidobacteriota bacterium]